MRSRTASCFAAVLLLAASPASAEQTLPAGVAARVHGRDVAEEDVLERIARRWGQSERGRAILAKLVDDTCVELEAKRRGVSVSEDEVAAAVKHFEDEFRSRSGNSKTVADFYAEQHCTLDEFRRETREYLKQRKMALEELGGKPGDDLPEAKRMLWLSAIRRRLDVKTSGLPDGVLARIGDVVVDRMRFARALRDQLPPEFAIDARDDLVLEAAADHALAAAKVEVTDADVAAEIATMRASFAKDPRVKGTGLTFDEWLRQTRGSSEAELAKDRGFRSWVGLDRMLLAKISDEDVRRHWEANRDAYGERALVRQIYVAADDGGGKFRIRSFADAQELALRAKAAVLAASGRLGSAGNAAPGAPKSLAEAVTAVAKQFEGDAERRAEAGEPVAWTHVHLAGQEALDKAAFGGEVGALQGPIRCADGYRLLLVEERRPAPSFDEIKPRVREALLREAINSFRVAARNDPEVILAK
jgi:parvulin-like peptidyl-prolyl cis-trans isomerase-like protein